MMRILLITVLIASACATRSIAPRVRVGAVDGPTAHLCTIPMRVGLPERAPYYYDLRPYVVEAAETWNSRLGRQVFAWVGGLPMSGRGEEPSILVYTSRRRSPVRGASMMTVDEGGCILPDAIAVDPDLFDRPVGVRHAEIRTMLLHELGHFLGLADNHGDQDGIMYPVNTSHGREISDAEVRAVRESYGWGRP